MDSCLKGLRNYLVYINFSTPCSVSVKTLLFLKSDSTTNDYCIWVQSLCMETTRTKCRNKDFFLTHPVPLFLSAIKHSMKSLNMNLHVLCGIWFSSAVPLLIDFLTKCLSVPFTRNILIDVMSCVLTGSRTLPADRWKRPRSLICRFYRTSQAAASLPCGEQGGI